jgi:hypothetical protein
MNSHTAIRGWVVVAALLCGRSVLAENVQMRFSTPEDAAVALVDAAKAANEHDLGALFGPGGDHVLHSGDPVMDRMSREVFLVAYAEQASLMTVSPTHEVLYVGFEYWPFPVPLVKDDKGWRFDTVAGTQEILFRRIGRNELTTIGVCQAYVEAQQEYAAQAHDGVAAGAYAQKIASTPGKHDGLYWKSEDSEQLSPMGEFAADAAAEGYAPPAGQGTPFHGYYFRILTGADKSPAAGAGSYIVNGAMRGGFALIARPAVYDSSGVMTFIVNQDGVVYQKDLGPETPKIAATISRFNPDAGWQKVP